MRCSSSSSGASRNSPVPLQTFRPARLLEALQSVRVQHVRKLGDSPSDVDGAWLEALRDRIAAARSQAAVQALALSLAPRELWGTLELVAKDQDPIIRERCQQILSLRNRKDLLKPGWRLLIHYSGRELEGFVRSAGGRHGWDVIDGASYMVERFTRWFSRPELVQGMTDDMAALRVAEPDEWFAMVGVPVRSALANSVWREVLVHGSKEAFGTISQVRLIERAKLMPSEVQAAFGRNYFRRLPIRELWQDVALRFVRHQFGVPTTGPDQTPFWRHIAKEQQDAFRLWVQEQVLYDFFRTHGDTSGRFQFWRRYAKHWKEVFSTLEDTAMVMDFGHVGVIEFAEVGNAAYVYDARDFRRIMTSHGRRPADYKEQGLALHRVLHGDGWQYRAQYDMDRLILHPTSA